jgi:hypothetical protein
MAKLIPLSTMFVQPQRFDLLSCIVIPFKFNDCTAGKTPWFDDALTSVTTTPAPTLKEALDGPNVVLRSSPHTVKVFVSAIESSKYLNNDYTTRKTIDNKYLTSLEISRDWMQ